MIKTKADPAAITAAKLLTHINIYLDFNISDTCGSDDINV